MTAPKSRIKSTSPDMFRADHNVLDNEDLSLTDLSFSGRGSPPTGPSKPFSLLARSRKLSEPAQSEIKDTQDSGISEGDERQDNEEIDTKRVSVSRTHEERLQHDLFILRKLNAGFAVYNDALKDTHSVTQHVARQLEQSNALIDKYVSILAKSEATSRLIFDERWHGADDDEATLKHIRRKEEEERARKDAEERARMEALQREREREQQELLKREEREQMEAMKRGKLGIRAGHSGSRALRSSTRARGAAGARAAPSASIRGRSSSIPTARTTSTHVRSTSSTSSIHRLGDR